ncbi:MAG: caspase family protein [Archangium sp.]|nr:caspase family protein [Archangium sp.]
MLTLLAAAAPGPVQPRPKLFALVVGNNQPESASSPELKFADDDALALHHLLLEAGARSVLLARLDDQTRALHPGEVPSSPPSKEALSSAWERLRAELLALAASGQAVELLLFFSGHGDISEGEGYLALEGGRLTRSTLQAMLAASPARRNHVVIDACKAYFAVLGKGPGGSRAPYPGPFATRAAPSLNSGFVLSTSSDGDSHEWERYQAGIFSFEVRSGLRGSADVNGDGRVTYGELGGFLERANAGIINTRFRPDFLVVPPGGSAAGLDEAVLSWPVDSAALELDTTSHLYVETRTGDRLLEVNAGASQAFLLHLPGERPLFIRDASERQERILEGAVRTRLSALPTSRPSVTGKGALHVAFSQLFSRPFDASAVESFALEFALQRRAEPTQHDVRVDLRAAAPFVAGGAALVMFGGIAVGLERSNVNAQTSQRERGLRNDGIAAANVTIGVAGGVAAAALGGWLILALTSPAAPVEVAVLPGAGSLAVVGRW